MSHLDELDEFEAELELTLKKEYSAVFGLFRYCVLTQDATYLCNKLDLQYVPQPGSWPPRTLRAPPARRATRSFGSATRAPRSRSTRRSPTSRPLGGSKTPLPRSSTTSLCQARSFLKRPPASPSRTADARTHLLSGRASGSATGLP